MNKNMYLVLGLLLVLLVGAGVFMMIGKKPTEPTPLSSATESTAKNPKSLKDLMASAVSQKCTYKDKMDTVDISGVTYVAGGKMRGDITSLVDNKQIATHIIVDGKTSYIWVDGQASGFKMAYDTGNTISNPDTKQSQQVDINKSMDFSCSPWMTDESMFTLPSNVKFTDYGSVAVPTVATTSGETAPQVNCSVCGNLTGESKTQCLTALKCN